MRGRIRLLIVALFAALFALLPGPDDATGKPYLGFLRVREWLLVATDSPLGTWQKDGSLPALQVDLRQSPPIEDPAVLAEKSAEYARTAVEWAAARSQTGPPVRVDPARGTLVLQVHLGQNGVQASLAQPDGSTKTLAAPFATRAGLIPAALAIGIAVLTENVLLALFLACLGGAIAFVASSFASAQLGVVEIAWQGAQHFVVDALWRRSICGDFYLQITLFVVFLFMTIGVMTRNGGIHGMVALLQRFVRGPVSAQLCTFGTGLLIFFDDYSNCLIAGTSMRPLCDQARVAREKLAWLVDSTAAPVAGLSVFSTWITYEISQYSAPLSLVTRADGTPYTSNDAYGVFLDTLPYRFYCLFTLAFVFLVIVLRRDFGPMLAAERRARWQGKPFADGASLMVSTDSPSSRPAEGVALRARNALLPIAVLVLGTIGLMVYHGIRATPPAPLHGFGEQLRFLLANADSVRSLLFASASAFGVAVVLTLLQRLLSVRELLVTSLRALRGLTTAFCILFLAWTLGHLSQDLGTSLWLTAAARGVMAAAALPLVLFLVAGLIAFATGTSFGAMAILLPNVVVLAHQLGHDSAFAGSAAAGGPALMVLSIGAVLEGAIFGDHCSPISDTTVLSSLGCQCDHLAHVQTQLPYALVTMSTALVCGYLPMALLGPEWWWLSFVLGLATLGTVLLVFGRNPDRDPYRDPDRA
jgi:Na+/H+ antiporter NhaC